MDNLYTDINRSLQKLVEINDKIQDDKGVEGVVTQKYILRYLQKIILNIYEE
jgi:hypothetical protein